MVVEGKGLPDALRVAMKMPQAQFLLPPGEFAALQSSVNLVNLSASCG